MSDCDCPSRGESPHSMDCTTVTASGVPATDDSGRECGYCGHGDGQHDEHGTCWHQDFAGEEDCDCDGFEPTPARPGTADELEPGDVVIHGGRLYRYDPVGDPDLPWESLSGEWDRWPADHIPSEAPLIERAGDAARVQRLLAVEQRVTELVEALETQANADLARWINRQESQAKSSALGIYTATVDITRSLRRALGGGDDA